MDTAPCDGHAANAGLRLLRRSRFVERHRFVPLCLRSLPVWGHSLALSTVSEFPCCCEGWGTVDMPSWRSHDLHWRVERAWRKDTDFGVDQPPFKPAFVSGLSSDSGQMASLL